ncbi:phosphatase PAP2 family protein [Herbidospora yilanensis]|uniref:phosphatase PAP2 family protein n=1 Tax=Herbidospora yilanensis TaxID=354426 RepID=UPI00078365AD|nr:phosphatase PAP2 family protein [Herbidospora yilanensis]
MVTTSPAETPMAARGRQRPWQRVDYKEVGRRVLLPLLALLIATLGTGLLLVNVLGDSWLIERDEAVSREVAGERSPFWNGVTDVVSSFSDTPVIVVATAIFAIGFRIAYKRWRESVFLIFAVWSQSLIFLASTVVSQRPRPEVAHLDPAPPTSSWPSGHTSAGVAFYFGVAAVLTLHLHRHAILRWVLLAIGLGVPLAIAASRLYRGMHHLTDVSWGFMLGAACVAILAGGALYRPALKATGRVST